MPLRIIPPAVFMIVCASIPAAEPAPDTQKPVILLTGFEPFGRSNFNTSWDIVSRFEGKEIAGHVVKTLKLKVVYDEIDEPLKEAVEKLKPDVVISFGEGTRDIHVERVAANGYHPMKPKDNKRNPPPRERIAPDGPANIESGLRVDAILKALHDAKFRAYDSNDAGGYLCNECFYRLMALKDAPAVRGFVHVPVIKPSDEAGRKELEEAVGVLVRAAVKK